MTPGAAATPLAQLLRTAPVLTALAVDFRRGQWTFSLPPQPVGPGDYLVVRADDARHALDVGPSPLVQLEQPQGERYIRFEDSCKIGRGYGCYALSVTDGAGFDLTLWHEHCPDEGEDSRFRPGVWHGREQRRGTDGSEWSRRVHMVCDDFGNLVPVQ